MRLIRVMPDVADELNAGFKEIGRYDLAAKVAGLELVDRCRCENEFCATFYTQPKASLAKPKEVEELIIPMQGLMCIQLDRGQVVWVELLYRPEVREKLKILLP